MLVPLVAVLSALLPASPLAGSGGDRLVQLTPEATCTEAVGVQQAGGTVAVPALRVYRMPAATAARVVPGLRARGAVQHVSVNRPLGTLTTRRVSADPLSDQEWWRSWIGVDGLEPPGPGTPVTIVDSGIDITHPEFAGRPNTQLLNPQEPEGIGGEHGTMVASLVGAPANGTGIVGVYPEADLRVWDAAVGTGTEFDTVQIVNGIMAAAAIGRGVVNLSLGGSRDTLIEQAVNIALARGVLVVAASGNDGQSGPLGYPAALPHVLTVAATTRDGSIAGFSSASPYVDLAAPGANVLVASALERGYRVSSGTSFSSPLVAGAAAWVWTLRPELDRTQLFEIMRRSTTDIAPAGRDNRSGFGMLDVAAALAAPPPPSDPLEPNDDVDVVTPSEIYYADVKALTTRARPSARIAARMERVEDPRDVYRTWIPAGKRLSVTVRSTVDLDLVAVPPGRISLLDASVPPLARGAHRRTGSDTLTVPRAKGGRVAYVGVLFGRGAPRDATYTLTVRAL